MTILPPFIPGEITMPKLKLQGGEKTVTLKELREIGGRLNEQIRAQAAEFAKRKAEHDAGKDVELWPAESKATWDAANADYNECARALQEEKNAAGVAARVAELDSEQQGDHGDGNRSSDDSGDPPIQRRRGRTTLEQQDLGLRAWFRSQYAADGHDNIELETREIEAARACGINLRQRELTINLLDSRQHAGLRSRVCRGRPDRRDLSAVTGGSGAYTIPEGFVNQLETAMLYFGPMLEACTVLTTDTGNDLPYPTADDTSNTGEQLGESTSVGTSVDPTFGSVPLGAFKFSSKLVKVPVELLEDSAFDLVTWLGAALGQRLGRIVNTRATTGNGAATLNGIVTAATLGKTTASSTAIDETELIDLYHSVDRAYRTGPQVGWMMHDLIAAEVRKLQATNGDFYLSGLADGEPDSIMQKRLWFNNDMASTLVASNKTMLFGDLSKYMIRRVRGIRLRRLVERYADTDQEGFVAFLRCDGDLIDAGTHPVKYLVQKP
jgi:HK97 family phage major capsid protein